MFIELYTTHNLEFFVAEDRVYTDIDEVYKNISSTAKVVVKTLDPYTEEIWRKTIKEKEVAAMKGFT